jgi:hypothetical protein
MRIPWVSSVAAAGRTCYGPDRAGILRVAALHQLQNQSVVVGKGDFLVRGKPSASDPGPAGTTGIGRSHRPRAGRAIGLDTRTSLSQIADHAAGCLTCCSTSHDISSLFGGSPVLTGKNKQEALLEVGF